jgi:hypothetical protein
MQKTVNGSRPTKAKSATYGSSPTKQRSRRSRAEIKRLERALHDLLEADHPMTVRQVFYRTVRP